MKKKMKKKYGQIKDRLKPIEIEPCRLVVSKAKWLNNAQSPVLFMIDDLTNAWFDKNGNGKMDIGEDWGAGFEQENSAIGFLIKNLLDIFPQIKTALLTTVGNFQSFSSEVPFTYAAAIDATPKSRQFFRQLHFDDRLELGYHGLYHGVMDEEDREFIQEWKSFNCFEEAIKKIEMAKKIFKDCTGVYFEGGKYCGYEHNEFSDTSIEKSGFLWWCRDWTPVDIHNLIDDGYYDMAFFGENGSVVSVPTSVHGYRWSKAQIKRLLDKRLPISIQEHIAPYRTDGRVQKPNIVDDIEELRKLFSYLKGKHVWYATPSEAARYFTARKRSLIYDVGTDSFKIIYHGDVDNSILTFNIDASCTCSPEKPFLHITLPDGSKLSRQQYSNSMREFYFTVNMPIQNGVYKLKADSTPPPSLTASLKDNEILYSDKVLTGAVQIETKPAFCYLYRNRTGSTHIAKRKNNSTVSFFCVNSTSGERLIPVD